MIDVIVPVFRGLTETRRCLNALLRHTAGCEILVIDDASPEAELKDMLVELATKGSIKLIQNPQNLGFVKTVNIGMRMHPDRDVVLVNSDTEVPNGWLERLQKRAAQDPKIATVTPFSNNATLASYPRIFESQALPAGLSLHDLQQLFASHEGDKAIEAPTGVGFCLYVKRAALDEVGFFDEEHFGRGYGEESDFCSRARARGWKHVLAPDLFVFHEGGVSFGDEQKKRMEQGEIKMASLHPKYAYEVQAFREADPTRSLRTRVDLQRLQHSTKEKVLLVTHSQGGGIERHIQDLGRFLTQSKQFLLLRALQKSHVELSCLDPSFPFKLYFKMPDDFDLLTTVLRQIGVNFVHFHHLLGHDALIKRLPAALSRPYAFTVHDYFAICPQVNLVTAQGRYCGEPDAKGCNACLRERPYHTRSGIEAWRGEWGSFLKGAAQVICPSMDVYERMSRYGGNWKLVFAPHLEQGALRETSGRHAGSRRKILFIGEIDAKKGREEVIAMVRRSEEQKLPFNFHLIGSLWPSNGGLQSPHFFDHGPQPSEKMEAVVAEIDPDVICLPGPGPETYSYVLNLALRQGCGIVATKLGAFKSRLHSATHVRLLTTEATIDEWLKALREVSVGAEPTSAEILQRESFVAWEFYSKIYALNEGATKAAPAQMLSSFDGLETHMVAPPEALGRSVWQQTLQKVRRFSLEKGISRWLPSKLKVAARRIIYRG